MELLNSEFRTFSDRRQVAGAEKLTLLPWSTSSVGSRRGRSAFAIAAGTFPRETMISKPKRYGKMSSVEAWFFLMTVAASKVNKPRL
jgi:hypothetical protein